MDRYFLFHSYLIQLAALHVAAIQKKLKICEYLLQLDLVNVTLTAGSNETSALHYFVRQEYSEEDERDVTNIIQLFRKRGVDINVTNRNGETPLTIACLKGDVLFNLL